MKSTQSYFLLALLVVLLCSCTSHKRETRATPEFQLIKAEEFVFKSFVDCNMAEAWVGDSLRIFPGKYGEDPVWGNSNELKYADGLNADEVFSTPHEKFKLPALPPNVPPRERGLHGAVWFETMYQDSTDTSGKTLYGIYHNENYPETLPFDSLTSEGFKNANWPEGLRGAATAAAVCRIGIMKSLDGGKSWEDRGIFIEDLQPRMILQPHNQSITFAGGVGDPSAVACNGYLYLFYGEYGYPGQYAAATYDAAKEMSGQCISVARIKISDLDEPTGKAQRWDGKSFSSEYNGIGSPIPAIQIAAKDGGGPTSGKGHYYWGPSVSWNYYLNCWVMLMAKSEGKSWKGSSIYISFNTNENLGEGENAIQWSKPQLILTKPGRVLWYPSLQPMNTKEDIQKKNTSLRLGKRARLFVKDSEANQYSSEYIIEFKRPD